MRGLRALLAFATLALAGAGAQANTKQVEPELKSVVAHAITQAECFIDRHESAVWYKMMEPRLRRVVRDQNERLEILKTVFCEAHRPGEVRLPPGLVMAVIEVESRFDRWAVSRAGAVGLMQVMPFWPEELGMRRHELTRVGPNIRMGCAILRHYLKRERNSVTRALARYNGSVGRREYSDKVLNRWTRWNGADDLGLAAKTDARNQPVPKSLGN
jgi:soluble lytic murein transglycosylase-like protein